MEGSTNQGEATLASLQKKLAGTGIDTAHWGTGKAKTIEHLLKEIEEGETELISENGALVRKVTFGACGVFYDSHDGKRYQLFEDRQVFNDGRERRREMNNAVLEKIKKGEEVDTAMARGLQEELGVSGNIGLNKVDVRERREMSGSYPGLTTLYAEHHFEATLSDAQYRSEGYVEKQEDKSTYFVWKEV